MTRDELAEAIASIPPGRRIDGEPADEAEHFMVCSSCGQAVDMRDLAEVFRHDEQGHAARAAS